MELQPLELQQNDRTIQFQFNGNALEYFKIWIVNLALSIITLGIYSPWAKVRTKRYFYGNTTLDGSSFDYLADPLAILKGRIIIVAFILLYAVSTQYIPLLEFAFLIIYMIALPWMVIKSLQFNARNSAYRNIRFNFDGKLGEAIFIFIGLSFFSIVTLGFGFPYMIKRLKQFTVENSYFGTSKFEFHASGWGFYKIYLLPMIVPILGILAAIAIPAYNGYVELAKAEKEKLQPQYEISQPAQTQTETEEYSAEDIEQEELIRTIEACMQAPDPEQCTEKALEQETSAAGFGPVVTVLIVYMLMGLLWVYVHTRAVNLVINSSTLNAHSLRSTVRVRNMFFIYLTNLLAVIISLGLLIPWASIRLTKYRLANTAFIANGDLNKFITNQSAKVSATGGEFTEAFDVDLGF